MDISIDIEPPNRESEAKAKKEKKRRKKKSKSKAGRVLKMDIGDHSSGADPNETEEQRKQRKRREAMHKPGAPGVDLTSMAQYREQNRRGKFFVNRHAYFFES